MTRLRSLRRLAVERRQFSTKNTFRELSSANAATQTIENQEKIKLHLLEELVNDKTAAVGLRREHIAKADPLKASAVKDIPYTSGGFNDAEFYEKIYGVNCENVIGFLPLPIGVVGPLQVNNEDYFVPLATTEGALLASINRGATVIKKSGGAFSAVTRDGMTRAPVVELESAMAAVEFAKYIEQGETFKQLKAAFESTTAHGKLLTVKTTTAGRLVFIRFEAFTSDAMGMNMIGKGVNKIMMDPECEPLFTNNGHFTPKLVSLSSNLCTDKKPSAVNWVSGRGKSVVCETNIPESILRKTLKTGIDDMIALNVAKNLIGSSLAGSIGGNNAHSSNVVTALFLATGQDPAQNVESSNCLVTMDKRSGKDINADENEMYLNMAVTMPCIEVGTVGGGTSIPAQRAALNMLGVGGSDSASPGKNARQLAQIVAATVLAGEISLNAALCSNQLISAHMKLNRK